MTQLTFCFEKSGAVRSSCAKITHLSFKKTKTTSMHTYSVYCKILLYIFKLSIFHNAEKRQYGVTVLRWNGIKYD